MNLLFGKTCLFEKVIYISVTREQRSCTRSIAQQGIILKTLLMKACKPLTNPFMARSCVACSSSLQVTNPGRRAIVPLAVYLDAVLAHDGDDAGHVCLLEDEPGSGGCHCSMNDQGQSKEWWRRRDCSILFRLITVAVTFRKR
jgi:hypothetical protein